MAQAQQAQTMARPHPNNSRISISAQNSSFRGDRNLLYPQFTFVFYVVHTKVSTGPISAKVRTVSHTRHKFEHPIPSVESESNSILVWRMLANMPIPFRLYNNMFWSVDDEAQTDSNPSPLQSHADMERKIWEFARRIIRESRGYYRLRMTVTIEKTQVVYPQLAPFPYNDSRLISSIRAIDHAAIGPYQANIDDVFVPTTWNPVVDDNNLFEPIPEGAMEVAETKPKPAADWSVEALEKLEYGGSSDGGGASKLRCPVCMEDVMIGYSHLTRMPCSHTFHEDCILEWLKMSHTCPLCRFQLPTSNDI